MRLEESSGIIPSRYSQGGPFTAATIDRTQVHAYRNEMTWMSCWVCDKFLCYWSRSLLVEIDGRKNTFLASASMQCQWRLFYDKWPILLQLLPMEHAFICTIMKLKPRALEFVALT